MVGFFFFSDVEMEKSPINFQNKVFLQHFVFGDGWLRCGEEKEEEGENNARQKAVNDTQQITQNGKSFDVTEVNCSQSPPFEQHLVGFFFRQ